MRAFGFDDHNVRYDRWMNGPTILCLFIFFACTFYYLVIRRPEPSVAGEKYFFSGRSSTGSVGYVERVNQFLQKYLTPSVGDLDRMREVPGLPADYFQFENSHLVFYLPPDGDESSLRLVGFRQLNNREDSVFYFNSPLHDHLVLQQQNLDRRVFNIAFDGTRIESITIDEKIISVPLVADSQFWQNKIRANTDSLFKGFLFIKLANTWLPLPPATGDYTPTDQEYEPVSFYETDQARLLDKVLFEGKKGFEIQFSDSKSIHVTAVNDTLHLIAPSDELKLVNRAGITTLSIRENDEHSISLRQCPFELFVSKSVNNSLFSLGTTLENPFNDLSFIVHRTSGRLRYSAQEPLVDQFASVATRKIAELENLFHPIRSAAEPDNAVSLSYNPPLALYLEKELDQYIRHSSELHSFQSDTAKSIRMGISLLNTRSAEVLAIPWFDSALSNQSALTGQVNYNLVNHPIGSCFKPLLYFSTYLKFPQLSKLSLTPEMVSSFEDFKKQSAKSVDTVRLLGYPTRRFSGHSEGNGEMLPVALSKSSNLFPVITFLYALTGNQGNVRTAISQAQFPPRLYSAPHTHTPVCKITNGVLKIPKINATNIDELFKQAFYVEDVNLIRSNRDLFEYNYWATSYVQSGATRPPQKYKNYASITPERVSLYFDEFDRKGGDFRQEIVPWLLGSQNNRWNNVKLSEAFCRLITGRNVRGSFLAGNTPSSAISLLQPGSTVSSSASFQEAHKELLAALCSDTDTQIRGTWKEIATQVRSFRVEGIPTSFVMLAKTGTADDETIMDQTGHQRRQSTKTVHRGSFVFSIMTKSQYDQLKSYIGTNYSEAALPRTLGLTGVISLETRENKAPSDSLYYSVFAKNFLADPMRLKRIILLNKSLFTDYKADKPELPAGESRRSAVRPES
ncbi:hypothetical protein LZD49_10085 [Dyadobacter sp. CY261]|uniref:hypothetical protein n=1 Tax=Dyadobacter sp. CY261 TaxID=2907203 RepID=UPI001F1EB952|nr:hypothetical protein [Dyadobacter sp. CY261]MCF0070821.1 hypothetical protein [Dyadobacter sp. CY261]